MKLLRLAFVAAAAAGIAHWVKVSAASGPASGRRSRLELGGGLGGAAGPASAVAKTMWTPADPATTGAARPGERGALDA